MPVTRGQFAQLLAAGLFSVIYEDLAMHPEEFPDFFNVYSSTKAYEEDQLVAGLGAVPTKPEGEALKLDQPIQGGSLRYQHVSYGLGFQVTREMWDDDRYGIMKKVSATSTLRQPRRHPQSGRLFATTSARSLGDRLSRW